MKTLLATIPAVMVLPLAQPALSATKFAVVNSGAASYRIDGVDNPTLTLTRGETYVFSVNAFGHPFWIKILPGTGTGNAYNDGVTNNGVQSGQITFTVPATAPATLYYNCQFHPSMTGRLEIVDPPALPGAGAGGIAVLAGLLLLHAVRGVRRRRA